MGKKFTGIAALDSAHAVIEALKLPAIVMMEKFTRYDQHTALIMLQREGFVCEPITLDGHRAIRVTGKETLHGNRRRG